MYLIMIQMERWCFRFCCLVLLNFDVSQSLFLWIEKLLIRTWIIFLENSTQSVKVEQKRLLTLIISYHKSLLLSSISIGYSNYDIEIERINWSNHFKLKVFTLIYRKGESKQILILTFFFSDLYGSENW